MLTSDRWLFDKSDVNKDNNPNYLCTIQCNDQNITIVANLPQEFGTNIQANYDEIFSQSVSNAVGAVQGIGQTLGTAAKALGLQLTTQALTAQIWQGTSDFTFSLPLVFQAINDEQAEIIKPITDLYRLTLPGELTDGGFLTAPGPIIDPVIMGKQLAASAANAINTAKDAVTTLAGEIKGKLTGSETTSASSAPSKPAATSEGPAPPLTNAIKNNISLQLGRYMYFESVVIQGVDQTHYVQPLKSGVMSQVLVNVTFRTFYTPVKKDINNIFRNAKFAQGGGATSVPNRPTRGGQ